MTNKPPKGIKANLLHSYQSHPHLWPGLFWWFQETGHLAEAPVRPNLLPCSRCSLMNMKRFHWRPLHTLQVRVNIAVYWAGYQLTPMKWAAANEEMWFFFFMWPFLWHCHLLTLHCKISIIFSDIRWSIDIIRPLFPKYIQLHLIKEHNSHRFYC